MILVNFNKKIIKTIAEMANLKVDIDKVVYISFNDKKHKTIICMKANTASGLAFKGVKNFPVEGILTYNKGNNSIILFDDKYLVWDRKLDIFKFDK